MDGLKFIRNELQSKCVGKVRVWYHKDIEELNVIINARADIGFHYRMNFSQYQFNSKKALTEIVNNIKMTYISYLLDNFFKIS